MKEEGFRAAELKVSGVDLPAASPSEQQGLGPSHYRTSHCRVISNCKHCASSSICTHCRRRNICKDCGGIQHRGTKRI
jgi:hypothetical protein